MMIRKDFDHFRDSFRKNNQKIIKAEPGQKSITLPCRAPNNSSSITGVEWSRADLEDEYVLLYRDDQLDTTNQHPSFKNRVDLQDRHMKDGDVSLILKDVTSNDTGTYECRVKTRNHHKKRAKLGGDPISIITLRVVPPDQKIITAEPGQNVMLRCRAPNNSSSLTGVEWSRADLRDEYVLLFRDELFDPDSQHPSFKNRVDLQDRQMKDGDVSLILNDVTINDDGTYECRVFTRGTNIKKRASLVSDPISIITLSVVVPPDQKIITAEPGETATLTCRAPNNSSSITGVEWSRADLGDEYVLLYRDGRFDPENQHPSYKNRVDLQDRQMKDGDVSLILNDVTINDAGTYECRVKTGTNIRKRANLDGDPISIITLRVDPPGRTGGDTEDGGKEAGGKEDGSVGLIVGLSVPAVLLVAAVVGFLVYRKHKQQQSQNSYQPPVELQHV